MRKFKLLSLIALTAFATACSNSQQEVEQASESQLYSIGQNYLQEGNYSQAIRYLKAVDSRFPGSEYSEQAQLNLIYANYKTQDYTQALVLVDRFIQQNPHSPYLDYAIYMAALTNSALGDNFIQDFFGIDRSTRETTSMKTAFSNFQSLVQNFPNSQYTPDALARMAYIKDRLARHELEIYPDTQATLEALPIMQKAYEKMGLTQLAQQAATLVKANEGKQIKEVEKPKEPFLKLPSWLSFGAKKQKTESEQQQSTEEKPAPASTVTETTAPPTAETPKTAE